MRVAIPLWEGKVSPVFDTATRLLVVDVNEQKEESRFLYYIDENDLMQKCHRIRKLDLDTIICGAISQAFLKMLLASGLDVIREISGPAEEVLEAYLNGDIFQSRFLMPGCNKNRHRCGPKKIRMNKYYNYQRKGGKQL
jgi:predicted Fe-Mo cluster-binding NifX family protein